MSEGDVDAEMCVIVSIIIRGSYVSKFYRCTLSCIFYRGSYIVLAGRRSHGKIGMILLCFLNVVFMCLCARFADEVTKRIQSRNCPTKPSF